MEDENAAPPSSSPPPSPHVIFIHLDLGIGGAEQLIINLARATIPKEEEQQQEQSSSEQGLPNKSNENEDNDNNKNKKSNKEEDETYSNEVNGKVSIYTAHCSQTHCFSEVRKASSSSSSPPGILASSVKIRGAFLPRSIGGKGTALCSAICIVYLSYCAIIENPLADVFVIDVLPTSIPFLIHLWGAKSVLYYCHFPDKLLTRDTVNGIPIQSKTSTTTTTTQGGGGGMSYSFISIVRTLYRYILDQMEEWTMKKADLIVVNSKFTKSQVHKVFPSVDVDDDIMVLNPPVDIHRFIPPSSSLLLSDKVGPILSLNRFERKKNVELLLHAYAILLRRNQQQQQSQKQQSQSQQSEDQFVLHLPKLVIAGGYDPQNLENVSYLSELQTLSNELHINPYITFRPSVSDEERASLLRSALCLCYTPRREHFGIVPLEAMYAGTPVIALNSGGPMETVLHGITGYLVGPPDTDDDDNNTTTINDSDNNKDQEEEEEKEEENKLVIEYANAISNFISNPSLSTKMGQSGHEHVKAHYSLHDGFRYQWFQTLYETRKRGLFRINSTKRVLTIYWRYALEATIMFLAAMVLTRVLRELFQKSSSSSSSSLSVPIL